MFRDGICQVTSDFYTKMVEFYDINYDLLEVEDQGEILEEYSKLTITLTRLSDLNCFYLTDRSMSRR